MFYEQAINGGIPGNNVGPPASTLQSLPAQLPHHVHHQFSTNPYFGFFPQTTSTSQPHQAPALQTFAFSPQHRQNSQDFLNSSQTEKSWLNSSLNEKNWLNNSLNLPSEQRYQSLNEMVTKIVEDEKTLMASGNANTLLSMRQQQQQQQQHQQLQQQQQHPPFQMHQTHGHVPFYRQESSKSRESSSLNSSFNSIFSPSHYNPFYQQLQQESQPNRVKPEFNTLNNNKLNGQSFQSTQKIQQGNENTAYFPKADERYYYQGNQQQQSNQKYYANTQNDQMQYDQKLQSMNNQSTNEKNLNAQNLEANSSTINKNNNNHVQQHQNQLGYAETNEFFVQPPFFNQNPNFINQYNGYSLNTMPLAFPPSFSHQLATLSLDQQKYLLEQQRALVLTLAVTEQMAQIQLNQQGTYGKNIQAEILLNTKPQSQNYTSQYSVDSNNSENKTNNLYPIIKQPIYNTQPFQSKENLPPPFIPGQKNYPPNNILRNNQGSRSYPNQNFSNFQQNGQLNENIGNVNREVETSKNFYMSQFINTPNMPGLNFIPPAMYQNFRPNVNLAEFQKFQMKLQQTPMNGEINGLIENAMNDPITYSQLAMHNMNNEKLRLLAKQPYRHHRRTGPANELHVRLEECLYQFKCLEAERKKIETELYHLNISKKPFVNNHLPPNVISLTRLPSNPSRVDRLIVESAKEYIKQTLQKWFDSIIFVSTKRKEEIINNTNKQRIAGQQNRANNNDDKDVIELANFINDLCSSTSKARTSLWCALQISNVNYKQVMSGSMNSSLIVNESIFNTTIKTNEFVKKTLQIKTDLIDIEKSNGEKL